MGGREQLEQSALVSAVKLLRFRQYVGTQRSWLPSRGHCGAFSWTSSSHSARGFLTVFYQTSDLLKSHAGGDQGDVRIKSGVQINVSTRKCDP